MSDELEPGYLLVLVFRHYPRLMGRNNSLVQCPELGNYLRIKRAEVFYLQTGRGGSGGDRKIIETRRPAIHYGIIQAVAGLDLEMDKGDNFDLSHPMRLPGCRAVQAKERYLNYENETFKTAAGVTDSIDLLYGFPAGGFFSRPGGGGRAAADGPGGPVP